MITTHLLVADVTDEALATLKAANATVKLLHLQPQIRLVALQDAIYHGRHPQDVYFAYTLNPKTGAGICYWDDDPLTRTLYHWREKPVDTSLVAKGESGKLWPAGLSPEQAACRSRVPQLCAMIMNMQKLPGSSAWMAQQDELDALASQILRAVAALLPEDVREPIERAIAHHRKLEQL